jgi:prepilin-type N-terminal cleavage/methylation domain-containing protein
MGSREAMGPRSRASRTVSARDSAGCWRALKGEQGFSLVEVLLAMALSAVGIAATIGVFGASSRTTARAQQGEVGAHQAQAELDRLSKLPYGRLAMTSLPAASTDPQSPGYGVNGSQFNVRPGLTEALVTQPGEGETAQVDAGPDPFAVGQDGATITGRIYRFVTWRDEQCPATICDGTQNTKRLIVAATVDPSPGSAQRGPLWFSTVITDPRAAPAGYTGTAGGAGGGGGSNTSAQLFYLYDTPCSQTSRQTPGASHNTRSTAQTSPSSSSYSTCQNPDASKNPDLMGPAPPSGTNAPVYEYSADLGGDYPGGLAMMRKGTSCKASYSASDAANTAVPNKWSVHAWATNPFATTAFHVSGRVTVSVYTATLSGVAGRGVLCATLIERTESGGIASDTAIGSTTYDIAGWPTSTRRLSFTFNVSPALEVEVGHRLVLALHLRGESANDIAILYDHPSYQSLLEVETSTPL